jgi:D-lactate dehydrogenase (cytochrome)
MTQAETTPPAKAGPPQIRDLDGALERLRALLGSRLATGETVRRQHGGEHTWHDVMDPDAVAFVERSDEVAEIVRICRDHKVPVIAFGAGSSLEGHLRAPLGGISIDFSGLNAVRQVNSQDMDCVVEPGVTRKQLNEHLRDTGLFFPIDPGADATIGGMAATRASGTNAVRYGTMRDNVLSLKAVLADGTEITTARRARKSAAGYDLTKLLVGCEGTLAIFTEITLRLHGIPEAVSGGVAPFSSLKGACDAAIETIQMGIPAARVELLDDTHIAAVNLYSNMTLEEKPTLFVEFHGTPRGVGEQAETFGEIAKSHGCVRFDWSSDEDQRRALWHARDNTFWAAMALRPGCRGFVTDVCVPISRLADCVAETQADIRASDLVGPIVGHVGDGNFHVNVIVDPSDEAEIDRVMGFSARLAERALAMEGTCTGEHGIGLGKMAYLEDELGDSVDFMRDIKRALDPDNILNPGKIFAL